MGRYVTSLFFLQGRVLALVPLSISALLEDFEGGVIGWEILQALVDKYRKYYLVCGKLSRCLRLEAALVQTLSLKIPSALLHSLCTISCRASLILLQRVSTWSPHWCSNLAFQAGWSILRTSINS